MFQSPGNIAFEILGKPIYYYSICIATGIILGSYVSYIVTKKCYKYLDENVFYNYTPILIFCAIICARLYYVILCWNYFSKHLAQIPMIWTGGLTIHGAVFGGILGGWIKTRIDKISFFAYSDAAPWGILVGQIIGRFGNFFNSEAFGTPTNLPWKLYIAPQFRPEGFENFEYFHPTFLYEAIWNIGVFLLLFFVFRKLMKNIRGGVFFMYLILYSVGRILIESIRTDTVSYFWGIPTPTWVSIITIIISVFCIFYSWKNQDKLTQYSATKPNKTI